MTYEPVLAKVHSRGTRPSHLDKSSRVVAVQIAHDKAALLGDAQLGDAALDELVCGHLLISLQTLLVRLCIGDAQQGAGPQGVVQLHQWVAAAEGPPQQSDGVGVVVGLVLLLGHEAVEAVDGAQAHLQRQTSLEERRVFVGALVEDVVGGLDGPTVDGGGGRKDRRGVAEEGGGGGGVGGVGVAGRVVRVGRVLALEALVGHEGGRPAGRGNARVRAVGRRRGNRGGGAHQSRVKREAAFHIYVSSASSAPAAWEMMQALRPCLGRRGGQGSGDRHLAGQTAGGPAEETQGGRGGGRQQRCAASTAGCARALRRAEQTGAR